MENKHQVHNLIILDESGSMESIKNLIMKGFNEMVQNIKGIHREFPEQEHFISFISFNGIGKKILHFVDPVDKIAEINQKSYRPEASTPLYDALGFGIQKLDQFLENKTEYNVLVTILTDGEENASREFNRATIKLMIEERKDKNWTFTYIGTEHDIEKSSVDINIDNHISFNKNVNSINAVFMMDFESRRDYSNKIRNKEDVKKDFYKK